MMGRRIIERICGALVALTVFSGNTYSQTDADACHFWTDRGLYNPAYLVPMTHASVVARVQQAGFKGMPFTGWLDFTQYKGRIHSLFGAQVHADKAGFTYTTKADIVYAYSLGHGRCRVNLGLSGGIAMQSIDEDEIKYDDMTDEFGFEDVNKITPNFNFGIEMVHRPKAHGEADELMLGCSVINIEDLVSSRPMRTAINAIFAYGAYRLRMPHHLDLYSGAKFQLYDLNRLNGELHCNVIQTRHDDGDRDEVDMWNVGLSYRHNFMGYGSSDIVINCGIGIGVHVYIGYSFDFVVHGGGARPFSSHELIIQYKFKDRGCLAYKDSYMPLGGK